MGYILDTHTVLWFVENDPRLSPSAKSAIIHCPDTIFVSVVSIWEIVIKVNIGKLNISGPLELLLQFLADQDIEVLAISPGHLSAYLKLPLHHRDPFDRMIIVQAIDKNLTILGKDIAFDQYEVSRKWA